MSRSGQPLASANRHRGTLHPRHPASADPGCPDIAGNGATTSFGGRFWPWIKYREVCQRADDNVPVAAYPSAKYSYETLRNCSNQPRRLWRCNGHPIPRPAGCYVPHGAGPFAHSLSTRTRLRAGNQTFPRYCHPIRQERRQVTGYSSNRLYPQWVANLRVGGLE